MSTPEMKFYVAADFAARERVAEVIKTLEAEEFEVCARWCTEPSVSVTGVGIGSDFSDPEEEEANARRCALLDLEDIETAKIFIQLTTGDKARGGRHVELGYALALAKQSKSRSVIVVGPREHVFHYHANLTCVPDLETLKLWLAGYKKGLGF